MKLKVTMVALVMMLLSAIALAPLSLQAASPAGTLTTKVTGTLQDGSSFKGKIAITRFVSSADGSQLFAEGTLKGTVKKADGTEVEIKQAFQNAPVALSAPAASQGVGTQAISCQILFLDLGPIFLDVLGLQVNLSRIVLDISAVPGAGNLLGNLLCAVVGLLDGFNLNLTIADLLNQILALLR